jgi:hypothetical protein
VADPQRRVIRASEVGQYAYCAQAWWLGSVEGHPSAHREALRDGTRTHRRHGRRVRATARMVQVGYVLLGAALLTALLAAWQLLAR